MWELRDGRVVVVRPATTAVPLLRLAGPGIPEVVSNDGTTVATAYRPPLALRRLDGSSRRRVLADVADVLARGHATGITHGPLEDEHIRGGVGCVLVDGWLDEGCIEDDLASFGRLVERHAHGDPVLVGVAQRALAPSPAAAASLAAALRPSPPRRRPRWLILAGGGLAATALAFTIGAGRGAAAAPSVVFTAHAVTRDGRAWRPASADDIVGVVCDAPVVLHRASGEVFAFDDWQTPRVIARNATAIGARGCAVVVQDDQKRWRTTG